MTESATIQTVQTMTDAVALIVDDEEVLREYMARILQREGYKTVGASDGVEALDLIRAAGLRINLLVSDIRMPKMDGGKLAQTVRNERPDVAIVLVSGYADEEQWRHLQLVFEVVRKPFLPNVLLDAVSNAMARRIS